MLTGRPPGVQRIAIFRALYLGDLLCTVPAWRALRRAYPEAHISLIGLPWAREFAARFSCYLDEWIEFPGYPGLPERPPRMEAIPSFLGDMQARRFEMALQMHGNGRCSNALVALFGAASTSGFVLPGEYCPSPERFLLYPEGVSEVHRHLQLIESLGIPSLGDELEIPLTPEDRQVCDVIRSANGLVPGTYACVHPGGRGTNRRWAPERFSEVADALVERGLQVVITGTTEEAPLARIMEDSMRTKPVNVLGRTDLGALAALMEGARLLVANDTGVSHMAAAVRLPSVIVVTGSDPLRWGPLDRTRHRLVPGETATVASVLSEVDAHLDAYPMDARGRVGAPA